MDSPPKKGWLIGLGLIPLILVAGAYLVNSESYELNKHVRLVWMRLLRYRELSLHRGCAYRIQFEKENYRVSVSHPGREGGWQEQAVFPYGKRIAVATPGLTVIFDSGRLVAYFIGQERARLKSSLILHFFHQKKPERRRGILFTETGGWRAL